MNVLHPKLPQSLINSLIPALEYLAKSVRKMENLSRKELNLLALGSGIKDDQIVDEMEIWLNILLSTNTGVKDEIMEQALMARGIPQDVAKSAIEIIKKSPIFTLRGKYLLPDLVAKGFVEKLGLGGVVDLIAMSDNHILVIFSSGAIFLSLSDGKIIWEIDCPVKFSAVDPEKNFLALGSIEGINIWDLTNGKLRKHLAKEDVFSECDIREIHFHPHLPILGILCLQKDIYLWDLETNKVTPLAQLLSKDHVSSGYTKFAFSSDGKLVTNIYHFEIVIIDIKNPSDVTKVKVSVGSINELAISYDKRYIALGQTCSADIYDMENGAQRNLHKVDIGSENFYDVHVKFSPDSNLLAIFDDYDRMAVNLWDLDKGELNKLKLDECIGNLIFLPNNERLVVSVGKGSNLIIQVIERLSGKPIQQISLGPMFSGIPSPNCKYLVQQLLSGQILIKDFRTNFERCNLIGHSETIHEIKFSSDGHYLATRSNDHTVRVWDLQICQEVDQISWQEEDYLLTPSDYSPHRRRNSVTSIAVSQNGSIALGYFPGKIEIWKFGKQKTGLSFRSGTIESLELSATGDLLACIWDEKAYLIHLKLDKLDKYYEVTRGANRVVISPDSRFLAIGEQKRVEIWDISAKKMLVWKFPSTSRVDEIQFNLSSNLVAYGSPFSELQVWDIYKNRKLFSTNWFHGGFSFIDEGLKLAAWSEGALRIWSLE